jgi:hypothetical protein
VFGVLKFLLANLKSEKAIHKLQSQKFIRNKFTCGIENIELEIFDDENL